ncbi:NAD-dependent epimerase/dehydratase [Janthinobacterium sp. HH01]|uniref:SDR family oxidoreductase n=1 Tax=Janthinobacterium sp. HH01 TaxID=1198452 RepID=UPI0002AECF30|nr:SDR family oxidoreductase [Janthinobacterium sp. HH01]ELX11638.1 NAD-dependent epimerase/dehydratase [Janthinobacterium sp. HH01]
MRVFVTGATGFVGSAVVAELIAAGHQVTGLARSDASAQALAAAGAQVHRGDLEDVDSLRQGAAQADGVIHTGFNHDFSKFQASCEMDRRVIDALGSALAGSARPLVVTSAMGVLPRGLVSTELSTPIGHPRAASEQAVDALLARAVQASVLRLPPSVHGAGDHGFVPILIETARRTGVAAMVDGGLNRWPAVHRLDAARLYRLALEQGEAGRRYHAAAEEGVAFRDIAGLIGDKLGLPVASLNAEQAAAHFGWFANFAAMDIPSSSAWTRATLGWLPAQPELLSDLRQANYFG